jgi:UTP--glucose-1-phosphate uridylyltransferase
VPREWIPRYGIVDGRRVDDDDRELYTLERLVEKPATDAAPTDLAIAGRYLFTPGIFDCLADLAPGQGGEIQLTDAMNILAGRQVIHALAWRARRYDIGNKADYVRCFLDFARRHPDTAAAVADYLDRASSD